MFLHHLMDDTKVILFNEMNVLFIMLINLQLTKKKKIKKLENFQKQSVIYATLINIIIEFLIINIYY